MAVIHKTTMTPGKLELLAAWVPTQSWYIGTARAPELTKAGGFRFDDPQGEVGIEFMVVTDRSGDRPLSYHAPLSYRGAPLDGADQALIGTSEHGVLGRRWVYDGTHDPVVVAQLLALLQSRAEPQAQSETDTPDLSVTSSFTGVGVSDVVASTAVDSGRHGTDIALSESPERLTMNVVRVPDLFVVQVAHHGNTSGSASRSDRAPSSWFMRARDSRDAVPDHSHGRALWCRA